MPEDATEVLSGRFDKAWERISFTLSRSETKHAKRASFVCPMAYETLHRGLIDGALPGKTHLDRITKGCNYIMAEVQSAKKHEIGAMAASLAKFITDEKEDAHFLKNLSKDDLVRESQVFKYLLDFTLELILLHYLYERILFMEAREKNQPHILKKMAKNVKVARREIKELKEVLGDYWKDWKDYSETTQPKKGTEEATFKNLREDITDLYGEIKELKDHQGMTQTTSWAERRYILQSLAFVCQHSMFAFPLLVKLNHLNFPRLRRNMRRIRRQEGISLKPTDIAPCPYAYHHHWWNDFWVVYSNPGQGDEKERPKINAPKQRLEGINTLGKAQTKSEKSNILLLINRYVTKKGDKKTLEHLQETIAEGMDNLVTVLLVQGLLTLMRSNLGEVKEKADKGVNVKKRLRALELDALFHEFALVVVYADQTSKILKRLKIDDELSGFHSLEDIKKLIMESLETFEEKRVRLGKVQERFVDHAAKGTETKPEPETEEKPKPPEPEPKQTPAPVPQPDFVKDAVNHPERPKAED